jgi:hypothetical protein
MRTAAESYHVRMRKMVRVLALVGVGLAALAADAASLDVVLRTKDGAPISEQPLSVQRAQPGAMRCLAWNVRKDLRAITGLDGRCRFDGLAPGSYDVCGRFGPSLVDPADNPFAPPQVVTLVADDDRRQVTIELWPGATLVSRMSSDRRDTLDGTLSLSETALSIEKSIPLKEGTYNPVTLLPGHWEARLVPPSGFSVSGIEYDGVPSREQPVRFEAEASRTAYLEWRVTAPCRLEGRLNAGAGPAQNVTVVAQRLAAGQGVPGAIPGTEPDDVHTVSDPTGWFETDIPDGVWRVRPAGDRVVGSEPEHRDVTLLPGGTARADFDVTLRDEAEGMNVYVKDPDGRFVGQAWVEAWSDGASAPTAAGQTTPWAGPAVLRGLSPGEFKLVAGHEAWQEGNVELHPSDFKNERSSATVTLERGATIRVVALDAKDEPVPGVTLTLTPPAPPPGEPWRRSRKPRTVQTDLTGYATLEGLAQGTHRLHAAFAQSQGARLLQFKGGDRNHRDEIQVTLDADERRDLELRVLPAAEITGRIACSDGGQLPSAVSLRVYEPDQTDEPDDPKGQASFTAEVQPLEGPIHESFRAGPLPSGGYLLAIRPRDFDRWTWAVGTEQRHDAAVLLATAGEPTDAGLIEVHCRPRVRVEPKLDPKLGPGSPPIPDLRQVIVRIQAWQVLKDGTERPLDPERLPLVRLEHAIEIRGFPEGRVRLRVELSQRPDLVPAPAYLPLTWEHAFELKTGQVAMWTPAITTEHPPGP